MAYEAVKGVIRRGAPEVTVTGDPAAPATLAFTLFRGKTRLAKVQRAWPGDFTFEAGEPTRGRARLDALAPHEPVSGVKVETPGDTIKRGPDWALVRLFPTTELEFEQAFYKRKARLDDRETLQFSARQITAHYPLNEAHRAVAAVVQGYAAMDVGDDALCAEAIDAIEAQIPRMEGVPATGHLRTDGVHQTGSMYGVLWQLKLFLGRYDGMIQSLDAYIDHMRRHRSPFGRVVFNGCMSMLMRTWIHARCGEVAEARALARFSGRYYVDNMVNLEQKAQWFEETQHSHTAVILALKLAERLETGRPLIAGQAILAASHRVVEPSAVAVLKSRFAAFDASLGAAA